MEENKNVTEKQNKKKESKINKPLIVIGLFTLIILLLLLLRSCSLTESQRIVEGDIDGTSRNVTYSNEEMNGIMFSTFLNKNVFVDENNEANILVKNDKSNSYDAYVEYYINDKLVYKTDIISPGYKQETADFRDVKLSKGENDATSVFCIVDSDGKKLNTVTIPIKITK